MRITEVEAIPLLVPLPAGTKAPIAIPNADRLAGTVFKGYRACLVRVHTDEGAVGIGECMVRLTPEATGAIVRELGEVVVGLDPVHTGVAWELMFSVMMNRGHLKGFFMEALSGIDIALWDLKGKALDRPVYELLGGAQRDRIWSYASSLRFRGLETTVQEAKEFVEAGYNAMKLKIGSDKHRPDADIELATAVREAVGPEVFLSADANCGFERPAAMKVARALQELDYAWFEEPIPPDDHAGYAEMAKALDMPIAGGETEFTRFGFRQLFTAGALDIVQPNISRAGGFTECMRTAALAEAFHVPYAPHTGSTTSVCHAAEIHLSAALPNFLIYEDMQADWSKTEGNPLREGLLKVPVEVRNGSYLELPKGPGLGIELNEDVVERYRVHR
ncbi:mandelate racemase/muconate lactonizing enzyme family protein [Micromonospora sp. NPDC005305]|uniref:mandelate racemase/muconate lactonizing enzyme family protein n=1 Tax=Micromonospora sp. NPDC005305 TaxID=3156875 RepID=UPI00339F9CC2